MEPRVHDESGPRLVGEPGACDRCGSTALIERFDLVRETQHERCGACGARWVTPFAQLAPMR